MSISCVGVDIAKSFFHVHGVDRHDQVEWRRKYKRDRWLDPIVKCVPINENCMKNPTPRECSLGRFHPALLASACVGYHILKDVSPFK
jgi:hypothetical protein